MAGLMKYFIDHWQGKLSLAKSVLLNGLLAYILLIAFGGLILSQILTGQIFFYPGMTVFFAWFIWACVGIMRCSIRILFSSDYAILVRLAAVLSVIGVAFVLFLSVKDILRFM